MKKHAVNFDVVKLSFGWHNVLKIVMPFGPSFAYNVDG